MNTPSERFTLIHSVSCSQCRQSTQHRIEASVEKQQGLWPGYDRTDWSGHYSIVTCSACGLVGYLTELSNQRRTASAERTWCHVEAIPLPPLLLAHSAELLENLEKLPEETRDLYLHTVKALYRDEDLFAGVGLRCLASMLAEDIYKRSLDPFQSMVGLVTYVGLPEREYARKFHHFGYMRTAELHKCFKVGADRLKEALGIIEAALIKHYIDANECAKESDSDSA